MHVEVRGDVDARAVEQLKRCADAGDAVAAAICADGHVGYSQPIGGVVAYRDYISPSGVGYDIGCVDAETEFLTPTGWKRIAEYQDGDDVLQYWLDAGTGTFEAPTRFIVRDYAELIHLRTKYGVDQMLSPDHRMLIWPYRSGRESGPEVVLAEDFAARHNALKLGMWANFETAFMLRRDSQIALEDAAIRVQVMVNADAYLDVGARSTKAVVSVRKQRKAERARHLLETAGIEYSETSTNGYTTFRFTPPAAEKSYERFWDASPDQLAVIADEVLRWDGSEAPKVFFTRDRASADFIQYAFTATGRRAVLRSDVHKSDGGTDYRVFVHDRTRVGMRSSPKQDIERVPSPDGKAYCFTVPSGFWVMRRNGKVAVTGNCGNKASRTNLRADDVPVAAVMDEIVSRISFGMGRPNNEPVDHPVLDAIADADFVPQRGLRELAASQLGTVGAGNHYVDLFRDDDGWLWVGVHFGSRGFGHKTATGFLAMAEEELRRRRLDIAANRAGEMCGTPRGPLTAWFSKRAKEGEMDSPPVLLRTDSALGESYIAAMTLAGDYAYAGRDVVVDKVLEILGAESTYDVHNHHNYAWRERHFGVDCWVVRKGCTPAFPGQQGFVGATMGEPSVILEGVESEGSKTLLGSTVHGAGRVMSRTQAAGKTKRRKVWECSERDCDYRAPLDRQREGGGPIPCPDHQDVRKMSKRWLTERVRDGEIDWSATLADLDSKDIVLRGGAADEAPGAYKRLDAVLEAHADTIRIVHRLHPIGVAMAAPDVEDKYKD